MSLDLHAPDDVSDRLVAAVLSLAAEKGGGAVTSRTLAERAGLSASAVNYRFGSLEGLIRAALVAGDARRAALWQRLAERLEGSHGEPGDFGPLAFAALREVATSERGAEALFWFDTIEAARTGRSVAASGAVAAERAFWAMLIETCEVRGPGAATLQAFALAVRFAYGVFERPEEYDAWALALVQRFASRAAGDMPQTGGDCLLRRRAELEATRFTVPERPTHDTAMRILQTAIRLILAEGTSALTHRRIASEAGLSVSSVLHFYGARESILMAAYDAIYSDARDRAVPELPASGTLDTVGLMTRIAFSQEEVPGERLRSFAAMQGLILSAAMSPGSRPIAHGFLARTGATSMSLLKGLKSTCGPIGRLDAQLLSMTVTHAATLSLCGPDADADLMTIGCDLIDSLFVMPTPETPPSAP